jgi:hypothetical protein
MLANEVVALLTWSLEEQNYAQLGSVQIGLVSECLGRLLATLRRQEPSLAQKIAKALAEAEEHELERVLLAPETANCLMWPERSTAEKAGQFVLRALNVERRLRGMTVSPGREDGSAPDAQWTALNDIWIDSAGRAYRKPYFLERVTLDFDCRVEMNFGSQAERMAASRRPRVFFNDQERVQIRSMLEEGLQNVRETDQKTALFVLALTHELLILRTEDPELGFVSRSPERYLGRKVLQNLLRTDVDAVTLAEGLIHEATHTLLDLSDLSGRFTSQGRWVRDPALYDGVSRVISPWTGRNLDLPTYLQACFVWFGLASFWSMALMAETFDRARILTRLRAALTGFLGHALVDPLAQYQAAIREDVVAALETMQARIRLSMATEESSC